jgi:hypothetical protein
VWVAQLGAEARKPATGSEQAEGERQESSTLAVRPRGVLVYIAISLDLKWSDLPVKPLMVPLVQELLRQGVGRSRPAAAALAGQVVATPPQTSRLRPWNEERSGGGAAESSGAEVLVAVDEWGNTSRPMRHAGVWDAVDSGGGRRGVVVVNADPGAGDLTPQEQGALEGWLSKALQGGQIAWVNPQEAAGSERGITTALTARTEGRPTTAILLAAALALALLEMALARWSNQ